MIYITPFNVIFFIENSSFFLYRKSPQVIFTRIYTKEGYVGIVRYHNNLIHIAISHILVRHVI